MNFQNVVKCNMAELNTSLHKGIYHVAIRSFNSNSNPTMITMSNESR